MRVDMKRMMTSAVVVLAGLAAGALGLFAQWPDYKTTGPRKADGKIVSAIDGRRLIAQSICWLLLICQ